MGNAGCKYTRIGQSFYSYMRCLFTISVGFSGNFHSKWVRKRFTLTCIDDKKYMNNVALKATCVWFEFSNVQFPFYVGMNINCGLIEKKWYDNREALALHRLPGDSLRYGTHREKNDVRRCFIHVSTNQLLCA